MSKYLLASDYDYTLRRWPDDVSDEDKAAIRKFREAGNHFVIVSGRVYQSMECELNGNGFRDADMILTMSGSLATDANGEIIYENKGDASIIKPMLETLKELNVRLASVEVGKKSHSISEFPTMVFGNPTTIEEASELPYFTNFCSGFWSTEEAAAAAVVLKEKFGDEVNPLQNGSSVDLPPKSVNKGIAVKRVADMLGVPEENIYTAGDNYNDIDMLSRFHGRAMANSEPEVFAAAEKTVKSISEIIEEILSL